MRTLIQRVQHASVTIDGQLKSKIGKGLLVLVGIEDRDTQEDIEWLCKKIANLRIFDDENGVMNRSVVETEGEVMVVSQFTLHASTKKGNRPSYIHASKPDIAIPMYEAFCAEMGLQIGKEVQTGTFGADMKVELVNDFEGTRPDVPNVAAICTYPLFVETVKEALSAQDVKIASVAGGFPSSQTFMEIKIAETAMAVMQGADEIDVVMNLGYFLEENYDELSEEIQEIKESCRDAKLKVILETGALQTPESIQKAAVLAVYSGADFIKTSTGKGYPGATPEAVYTMCQVLKKYHSITGKRVGIKVAGGVRTAEEAVRYYTIVKEVLGNDWLNKDLFRIGASSLVEDIEHRLGK